MIHHFREVKTDGTVAALAVSGDSALIAVGTETAIDLFDVDSGKQVRRLRIDEALTGLAVSTDGRLIAVATGTPTVSVYDGRSGELVHQLIRSTVPDFLRKRRQQQVEFLPNTASLITRGEESDVTIWNCDSGEWEHLIRLPYRNGVIVVSPDGKHIALGSEPSPNAYQGQVTMWRVHQGLQASWNQWHDGEKGVTSAAFSPDTARVATCGVGDGIRVWSVESGALLARVDEPQRDRYSGVAFLEDVHHLLTIDSRTLKLRHLDQTGALATATSRQPGGIRGFGTSIDGALVVTFNANAALDVWKVVPSAQDHD